MKCHILPDAQLKGYGAQALRDAHNDDNNDSSIVGISIHNWQIRAVSHRQIANEHECDELTSHLQKASHKTLGLPEITFLRSFLSLQLVGRGGGGTNDSNNNDNDNDIENDNNDSVLEITFDARAALLEWAEAHVHLSNTTHAEGTGPSSSSYRGVSVLESVDAALWKQRKGAVPNSSKKPLITQPLVTQPLSRRDEFSYDWTYSTPYAGNYVRRRLRRHKKNDTKVETETEAEPIALVPTMVVPLAQSGIPTTLLTDRTQPILFYHDVTLYEDDLHDNGETSLSVKIRVMPTCWFLLQRLYVRVDHVMVRVRETRLCHAFASSSLSIYRDVGWRECRWEDLSHRHLPTNPRQWRTDDPGWPSLLGKLPLVPLPHDLPAHSRMDVIRSSAPHQEEGPLNE